MDKSKRLVQVFKEEKLKISLKTEKKKAALIKQRAE